MHQTLDQSGRVGGKEKGRKEEKNQKQEFGMPEGSRKLLLTIRLLQGFTPLLPQSPRGRCGERSVPQSPGQRPPPPPAATFTRQTPPGDSGGQEGEGPSPPIRGSLCPPQLPEPPEPSLPAGPGSPSPPGAVRGDGATDPNSRIPLPVPVPSSRPYPALQPPRSARPWALREHREERKRGRRVKKGTGERGEGRERKESKGRKKNQKKKGKGEKKEENGK